MYKKLLYRKRLVQKNVQGMLVGTCCHTGQYCTEDSRQGNLEQVQEAVVRTMLDRRYCTGNVVREDVV